LRAATENNIAAELIAVLASVAEGAPCVLTIDSGRALPSGPLQLVHRSLQSGLRNWVEQQTSHPLGYVEQLYTFADRDPATGEVQALSVSYLGLTRQGENEPGWQSWYRYFPWEDRRETNMMVEQAIAPRLLAWAEQDNMRERRQRCAITFGLGGCPWNEELVLQRYELLYEAGLVSEAFRDADPPEPPLPGSAMLNDHRRILATAIARLRAKIKYRPVVFELMPETFTLLHLQLAVEALAGRRLHKQNFRRLIEQQNLVEETGDTTAETGGRPAKLFRFRRELVQERQVVGTKLPLSRT
jgi:hypothetical protein